ncbi:MAG: metallophosphoesterase [Alistipes sp.]|nr:metallophosphoesterase [Alistipes sp.]
MLSMGRVPAVAAPRRRVRFGVVTDTHYADRERSGTRYYRDSIAKMREAVAEFQRADLDFIIELGDMKDTTARSEPVPTLRFLDDIEREFSAFRGPRYHVLGNHDMDCLTKEEFLAHTRNAGRARGKAFYSFSEGGVRCIVLDANFNEDRTPYARGNFDWRKAYIPASQIEWLDRELTRHADEPTLVFLHQMLDSFSDISKDLCVGNAEAVVEVLERHRQVLAVFQGHHHPGHYSHRRGIHYLTFQGMIEQAAPASAYAIVEVEADGTIRVEGFRSCPDRVLER